AGNPAAIIERFVLAQECVGVSFYNGQTQASQFWD
ncbi:unnamed protein product, partial [marine sediment metagenome]